MEKLVFSNIESSDEIDEFLRRFENFVGVLLPEAYAYRSNIVGAFAQGRLVGGYMLVTEPDFRALRFVPDAVKKNNPYISGDPYEMMEVNGLWISPCIKNPKLQLDIWFHLVWDIFNSRKKYVLLLRNSNNKNAQRLFEMSNPKAIYEGPAFVMAGEKTHNEIQVSVTTRWRLILNAYKYWLELKDRQRRAKAFKNKISNKTTKPAEVNTS